MLYINKLNSHRVKILACTQKFVMVHNVDDDTIFGVPRRKFKREYVRENYPELLPYWIRKKYSLTTVIPPKIRKT